MKYFVVLYLVVCGLIPPASAQTRTLRIAAYNIEADIDGVSTPRPGLIAPTSNTGDVQAGGVLEGIGEEIVGPDAGQPLDVLGLEETTSNLTVTPIINGLNAFYGRPGMYTNSSYPSTSSGGANDGGGPNEMVYNTTTLQLVASVPVDPSGGISHLGASSGEYREVMRYEFAPFGVTPATTNEFYVYVSHYKSGTNGADETARLGEAEIIRTNEAYSLSPTARVLYVGDYNLTNSNEGGYQTILSPVAPNGIRQGQGVDPLNLTDNLNLNWGNPGSNTNLLAMLTEHGYDLEYRDDLQVMTTNIYYGAPGGLQYVVGTYHAFGNNGTTPFKGSVNSGSDTALNGRLVTNGPVFISAPQLYLDLTDASDHIPIVADYTVPMPAPQIASFALTTTNLTFSVTSGITNDLYSVLMQTNLQVPLTNWTTVATYTAPGDNFTFVATNVVDPTAPVMFYRLKGN